MAQYWAMRGSVTVFAAGLSRALIEVAYPVPTGPPARHKVRTARDADRSSCSCLRTAGR